jgi:hypothetical protein
MDTVLTVTQVLATVFIAATFFVYVRQAKAMEAQLEVTRQSVADLQRATACRQMYEVITSLLDLRSDIESVLKLKDQSFNDWTDSDKESAQRVCSRFHLVGLLMREGMIPEQLFSHAWYYSVPHCFDALQPFLKHVRESRDSRYWTAFDYLARTVRRHADTFRGFADQKI